MLLPSLTFGLKNRQSASDDCNLSYYILQVYLCKYSMQWTKGNLIIKVTLTMIILGELQCLAKGPISYENKMCRKNKGLKNLRNQIPHLHKRAQKQCINIEPSQSRDNNHAKLILLGCKCCVK